MIVWDADGALERDAQIVVDDNGVTFQFALQRFVFGPRVKRLLVWSRE